MTSHTRTTPLDVAMGLHVPGQITWPEPDLGRKCAACRHFTTHQLKTAGKGRCDLVHKHGHVLGVAFYGAAVIACPQFEAGVHPDNRRT